MIILFLATALSLLAIMLWARYDLSRFLRTTSVISDEATLDEFKALARHNMYGAVAYLTLGAVFLAVGFCLVVRTGVVGTCLVLLFSIPGYYLSKSTRELEICSRMLRCTHPGIESEYARVRHSWLERLLPDF